jgi:hypothetical protein
MERVHLLVSVVTRNRSYTLLIVTLAETAVHCMYQSVSGMTSSSISTTIDCISAAI